MSDMEPWGLAHSRHSKPLTSLVSSSAPKCRQMPGAGWGLRANEGSSSPRPGGWKSVQDVLEKRARDRGLRSVPESRWSRVAGLLLEASRSNDFVAGRSRAAVWAVACGRASPGPCLREPPAPLGPAGRVGHVWGAELHLPGSSAVRQGRGGFLTGASSASAPKVQRPGLQRQTWC